MDAPPGRALVWESVELGQVVSVVGVVAGDLPTLVVAGAGVAGMRSDERSPIVGPVNLEDASGAGDGEVPAGEDGGGSTPG